MDRSGRSTTTIADLPPELVLEIISFLPFKEAVRTCSLRKSWRNLHRQMKNIVFKESEFVEEIIVNEATVQRIAFVDRMHQWMSTFTGHLINRFELYFPKPKGFKEFISPLIEFAVSKKVKILVLDFSDPANEIELFDDYEVSLPLRAHYQTTIESLKLVECDVISFKFANSKVLRSLTFCHLELGVLNYMLSRFPFLESLRFIKCAIYDKELKMKLSRLRELVFERCEFDEPFLSLELPELVMFKFKKSGGIPYGSFDGVNKRIQEAYLEFGLDTRRADADGTSVILASLLNGFSSAKTLTMCPFLLQMVPYEVEKLSTFGTRHLVLKTNLDPYEFMGINLIINTCPVLETLTLQIVPPRPMEKVLVPMEEFNANTYWLNEINHECLEKTLKVVEVKSFSGGVYELQVVKYVIKYGLVLERLDLYMHQDQMARVQGIQMALQNVPRGSSRLQITLHNA